MTRRTSRARPPDAPLRGAVLTRSASGASLLAEWAAGDTLRTVRMRDWFIGLNVVDKMFLRLPALVSRVLVPYDTPADPRRGR